MPTARHLAQPGYLTLTLALEAQLRRLSVSTVRRIVGPVRGQDARLAASRRPPRRRSPVARQVPTSVIPAHQTQPGHLEADTVFHCGSVSRGLFAYSLSLTDVATGWVATRATLGNSAVVMRDAFQALQAGLPFPILEVHTDNGPEFLNALLYRYLQNENVALTRSRPYHKNDNRFVEENNGSHIRAYVGYARYDAVVQVLALNHLYGLLDVYHNLFRPLMRRNAAGDFTVGTPLERLRTIKVGDAAAVQAWCAYRDTLDPFALRLTIADALNTLLGASAGNAAWTNRRCASNPGTVGKGANFTLPAFFYNPCNNRDASLEGGRCEALVNLLLLGLGYLT